VVTDVGDCRLDGQRSGQVCGHEIVSPWQQRAKILLELGPQGRQALGGPLGDVSLICLSIVSRLLDKPNFTRPQ